MGILSSVIGGASSIAGGLISDHSNRKTAAASWSKNYAAQKEFAQNSIQWRVQDAKKAGINPYAVVGGQTVGYTPQDSSYSNSFGSAISQAGNRLADAMGQLNLANVKADVEGKKLDNKIKGVELANKLIESKMGQKPSVITPVIKEAGGAQLITTGRGGRLLASPDDASVDDISGLRKGLNAVFDKEGLQALSDGPEKEHLLLGMTGYETVPKSVPLTYWDRVRLETAKNQEVYGTLSALGMIPSTALRHLIDTWSTFKPRRKSKKGGGR